MTPSSEPMPGDRVCFREGGSKRLGTVRAVITAGRKAGVGVWRLRRRARVQFEADGQSCETHRDLEAIDIVEVDEQRSFFDEIEVTE